jgi:cytochrome b
VRDSDAGPGEIRKIRVWDLPTRLFHWSIVLLVGVLWYTGKTGGLDEMTIHMWAGYAVLALLLFRLAWGVIGTRSSRFAEFVRGPVSAFRYARGLARREKRPVVGHNPLGGWMVVLLLISLLVQTMSGLFADDEIFTTGPLAGKVSGEVVSFMTWVHDGNFNLLLALAAVHVTAVLLYRFVLRDNLIRPMITGRKVVPADTGVEGVRFAASWLAVLLSLLAAAAVYGLVFVYGSG